ncbi:MAG: RusA family crossover junction endodeoxyribonuclease [Candidatus Heimdallarchaeaceae archaeon]
MVKSDSWKKRPAVMKYWAYKDEVRVLGIECHPGDKITFVLPMPKSWSEKKKVRLDGAPHLQKKDLDNLIKALWDSVHDDDQHLWWIGEAKKIWGREGKIIIKKIL